MPVVHICDDACTYVSHCLLRYPIEAELAFGQKRGCFQKPDETKEPQKNISCPDITPIELDPRKPNREAMRNQSILVHPDVTHQLCPRNKVYIYQSKGLLHAMHQ